MLKDGQTDMTKLTVAFCNFVNAPKDANTCQSRCSSASLTVTFRKNSGKCRETSFGPRRLQTALGRRWQCCQQWRTQELSSGGGGGSTSSVEDREKGDLGAAAPQSGVLEAAVIWYKKFNFIQ